MKKMLMLMLMMLFGANCFGYCKVRYRDNFFYYHNTTVVSNANFTLESMFCRVLTLYIYPTGTDTTVTMSIYVDPLELGETSVANPILIQTFTIDCTAGGKIYALYVSDTSSNVYGSVPFAGELKFVISDTAEDTCTDLKVWGIKG